MNEIKRLILIFKEFFNSIYFFMRSLWRKNLIQSYYDTHIKSSFQVQSITYILNKFVM